MAGAVTGAVLLLLAHGWPQRDRGAVLGFFVFCAVLVVVLRGSDD